MGLTASQLGDAMNLTLARYEKGSITDIAAKYTKNVLVEQMAKEERVEYKSGKEYKFAVMHKYSGDPKGIGFHESIDYSIDDVTAWGKLDWKMVHTGLAWDVNEINLNAGSPEELINLLKVRTDAVMGKLLEKVEDIGWANPGDPDSLEPVGVAYYLTKSATKGFHGPDPSGYSDGAADLPIATYPGWSNYTDTYEDVTADDFLDALEEMSAKTGFVQPTEMSVPFTQRTNKDKNYYTNYSLFSKIRRLLDNRNDNMTGRDLRANLSEVEGVLRFNGRPIIYVPALDSDDTDPIYQLDWATAKFGFRLNNWINVSETHSVSDKPYSRAKDLMLWYQFMINDRRRNGVIYKV